MINIIIYIIIFYILNLPIFIEKYKNIFSFDYKIISCILGGTIIYFLMDVCMLDLNKMNLNKKKKIKKNKKKK